MSRSTDMAALVRSLQLVSRAAFAHSEKEASRRWANSSCQASVARVSAQSEDAISDAIVGRAKLKNEMDSALGKLRNQAEEVVGNFQRSMTVQPDIEQDFDLELDIDSEMLASSQNINLGSADSSRFNGHTGNSSLFNKDSTPFSPSTSQTRGFHSLPQTRGFHYDAGADSITEDDSPKKKKKETPAAAAAKVIQSAAAAATAAAAVPAAAGNFAAVAAKSAASAPLAAKSAAKQARPVIEKIANKLKDEVKREIKKRPKPVGNFVQQLSTDARERRVPGTRLGRMASFGGLGAGLAAGALKEVTMRGLGLKKQQKVDVAMSILDDNPFLTEENAERIVNTLCRVRGAALKLGQMISIQDEAMINPQVQKIFDRVRQSADFMPAWQMERVLKSELGEGWRDKLAEFDEQPFAAASIGQVHRGVLHDGTEVAMKIQYPGVADSINSDIDNLMGILNVWNILPEGLYVDSVMDTARKELAWECDYLREAECSNKFRTLLADDQYFYVPRVIPELSTKAIITSELVSGVPVDRLQNPSPETCNEICENMLRLCLDELFMYDFMQTDPNWSNFLYDENSERLILLDFGATRSFGKSFTDDYIEVINCASKGDRQGVLEWSQKLGFLTGYEAKVMENAHVDSVMILGEAFAKMEPFDFGNQTTSARIHGLIPTMLKHRLAAPPEESYSLHRKMAGCFLLCSKLNAKIVCKPMFDEVYAKYHKLKAEDQQDKDLEFA